MQAPVGAWILLLVLVFGSCRCGDGLLRGRALADALSGRSDVSLERGSVVLQTSDAHAYRLIEAEDARAVWIETPKGRLEAAWDLFDAGVADPLGELDPILRHLETPEGARLVFDRLVGRSIVRKASGVICDRSGCAEPIESPVRVSEDRLVDIESAAAEIDPSELGLPSSAEEALRETLSWLALDDTQIPEDQFTLPSFVRRMVRHGWLAALGLRDADVVRAVTTAEQYETRQQIPLSDGTVFDLENAFGGRIRTFRSLAERSSRYALTLPRPAYFFEFPELTLVVEVAGDNPFDPGAPIRSARVFSRFVEVAAWSPSGGFTADAQAWQTHVQTPPVLRAFGTAPGAIPPHVLVVDPMGDVRLLATAYGELEPRDGADPASREAFLTEAARVLPDAPHLDLLGEFLYGYANDGPDPSRPLLIGTPTTLGDIHQTVEQTLATLAGGMYRGDCDDLSELYQTIAVRQGHNAHLIGLPAHAALAWSEQSDDRWWTYVLQTGLPQGVSGPTLRASIERAYRLFDEQAPINPEQIEILLRFSGENTRDTYHLSYRIFGDPDYARIMLDVQEDWHRFTFSAALEKMKALIDGGDITPANLREYASLLESTGQFAAAAAELERTLPLADGPIDRIQIATQMISNLFYAGRFARAREVARELIDAGIPDLAVSDELERIDLYVQLADALMDRDYADDLALEVLARGVRPILDAREFWYRSMEERFRLNSAMDSAIEALRKTGAGPARTSEDWQDLSLLVRLWIDTCAFSLPDPSLTVLSPYAKLGRYEEALEGQAAFRERVLAAPAPEPGRAHEERASGEPERDALDAQWVSLAPRYWWTAIADEIEDAQKPLDRDRILLLAHRTRVALAQAEDRGLSRPSFGSLRLQSEIVSAIAARDRERLRVALAAIHAQGDRELSEDAAGWIAALGRKLPEDELEGVIDTAFDALPQPQLYFRIAWRIALENPTGGVVVAERAAKRPDALPSMRAERAFMRDLVARGALRPPVPIRPVTGEGGPRDM